MISGWKYNMLPDEVLHFDVDITVVAVTPRWNLNNYFEPLQVLYIIHNT